MNFQVKHLLKKGDLWFYRRRVRLTFGLSSAARMDLPKLEDT